MRGLCTYIEHILVVCKSDDELDHKLTTPTDNGATSPPIGMLPVYAVVLLMDTDDVGCASCLTVCANDDTIEILRVRSAAARREQAFLLL